MEGVIVGEVVIGEHVRCYFCANGGDLVYYEFDDAASDAMRTVIAHEDDACPPIADGRAPCYRCSQARPLSVLTYTMPDDVALGWRQGVRALGIAGDTPSADTDHAVGDDDSPLLVCWRDGCVLRDKARAQRSKEEKSSPRPQRDEAAERRSVDEARVAALPDGWVTFAELVALWKVSTRTARAVIAHLLDASLIEAQDEETGRGGTPRKVYRRCVQ